MANEKKNAKTNTTELQAAIQSLIAKGKKEGMIRAADLQAHLDKLDLNPETIEKIYDQLDAMNIQVVAAELDLGDDLDLGDGAGFLLPFGYRQRYDCIWGLFGQQRRCNTFGYSHCGI